MKVLVTGATGFVGSHTAAALRSAGHDVRVMTRDRDRLSPGLEPVGVSLDEVEVVLGDCLDRGAVARALDGCEAAVHAANVYTWQANRQKRLVQENTSTTGNVLSEAVARGLRRVVHISSYVALLPSPGPLSPSTPVGPETGGYAGSKAAAERVARRLQDDGAPVGICYPGMVIGPHDPYFGSSTRLIRDLASSRRPVVLSGKLPVVDVRDVASALVMMIEANGPARALVTGHDLEMADLARRLADVQHRSVRPITARPAMVTLLGRCMDLLGQLGIPAQGASGALAVVREYPGTMEGGHPGLDYRDLDETLTDTIDWLTATGRLT